MDSDITRLADKAWCLYEQAVPPKRLLIGIAGIPGSGKSTLSGNVCRVLNAMHRKRTGSTDDIAASVSMDGFHYTRAQLAVMPDPKTAIHRRGAAFTFDAEGFYELVLRLHESLVPEAPTIWAPSFDHAVKDPVPDSIPIPPSTRIVVFEGNYVCLDREPWRSAAMLMDGLWFLDVDREVARKRLIKRHVASGICPDEQAARERIRSTDFLNADDILENRLQVDEVVSGGH